MGWGENEMDKKEAKFAKKSGSPLRCNRGVSTTPSYCKLGAR
jgi:hypothetical protein